MLFALISLVFPFTIVYSCIFLVTRRNFITKKWVAPLHLAIILSCGILSFVVLTLMANGETGYRIQTDSDKLISDIALVASIFGVIFGFLGSIIAVFQWFIIHENQI